MFLHYRTQGIVLAKRDRSETDQVLTIYTKDFGKLDIVAKAARKISSKLRPSAGLFYLSEIEFIQGKNYKTLTDAILINKFASIRNDLEKMRVAYQIAQDLDGLVREPEPDAKIWQLLNEAFIKLNDWKFGDSLKIKSWKLEIVYYYFFWNLVSLLGYQPEIKGSALGGRKINSDAAKIIKVILTKDLQFASRLKLQAVHFELLKKISEWYKVKVVAEGNTP